MAEIPKGTTGTKEVKHDKGKEWKRQSARKTKEQEEEKYKRPVLPVLPSRLSQRLSSRYSEEEYHGFMMGQGEHFEEGNIGGAGLKPQGYQFYAQSSSGFKEKHKFKLEGKQQSARKTKEQEEEKYKLPAFRYLAAPLRMLSSRYSEEEYYEGKPQSARMTTKQEEHQSLLTFLKHGRRISSEIDDLSLLVPVTNKMLPDQLHSLMEKLIEEQKQLVNLLQEMATSVKQRGTYRLLDPYASEDSSKLNVLLSKIHLVSLKLNLQRMKSVDEAQVKTDTKVSEKQHHDVEKAHSTLQTALKELGKAMKSGDTFRVSPFEKYDTQRYMTVSVYYCQQMLVDDLQALVPQTILVKEPVYHKQYMENLNVLIKTQQQLVQNLTGLQKQKKGSKLEKESPKQDDLSGGEIGKQQLNELELITEQTDLIKDLLHLIHLHENHYSHEAFFVICSLHMVTSVHDRSVMETWTDVIERRIRYTCTSMMYGIKGKHVLNEQMIMQSQRSFLDTVEVWNKRQTSEERKHMIFSAGYQSLQDDPTEDPDLEVIHSRMGEMSVSDKEDEKTSIESQEIAENTFIYDVIDKSVDEDSNLSAAGYTLTTQTTQAVSLKTPETPSHFKEVLKEFNNKTVDFSDIERTDILLQLPYMAVGFFNNNGGILALEKYDVHLYIPPGAIAEGRTQQVYIYVNPDGTVAATVNGEERQLSPEIHCGPPGLTFEHSVVLSFPHYADSSDWKFTAKKYSASSAAWQTLNSSTDGQLVSAKGNEAIFLVKHFCRFGMFGTPSDSNGIQVTVGAFGDHIFDPRSYAFRVYVWKDDRASEERVEELEKKQRSEMLDTYKDLIFLKDRGHMLVEMTETNEGWNVRPQTTQEIREEVVWALPQISVSFNVKTSGSSNADDIPYMAVNCYQQQQESKLLLSVGPKQAQMRNNNLNQTCDAQRHMCIAPLSNPAAEGCNNGSGDSTLQLPMTDIRKAISSAAMRPEDRRLCPESVRMYGGLSDQKVNELCEFLDNQAADCRGVHLLDYLSGNGYIPPNTTKKEVLTTYFSKCSKHNIPDQDAVHYLKLVFHELNYTGAAEIIEPGGQRINAEDESILQFLDNEPLMKNDALICLRDIAEKLGPKWQNLATYLGIINDDLTAVKKEGAGSVSDQIFCMLVKWLQGLKSFGKEAFNTLSSNMERVGRNDVVEFLKRKVISMLFFKRQDN